MKLTPIPLQLPSYIVHLAKTAPIDEVDSASKIRMLTRHFLKHQLDVPDMSSYKDLRQDKSFTLRMSQPELDDLNKFCQRKLYNRQQAFQIAIVASLQHLSDLY